MLNQIIIQRDEDSKTYSAIATSTKRGSLATQEAIICETNPIEHLEAYREFLAFNSYTSSSVGNLEIWTLHC